jgi:hypothetical protein
MLFFSLSPPPFLLLAAADLLGSSDAALGGSFSSAPRLTSPARRSHSRPAPCLHRARLLWLVESRRKPRARHGRPRHRRGLAAGRRHLRGLLAVHPYFTGKEMVGTQLAFVAEVQRPEIHGPHLKVRLPVSSLGLDNPFISDEACATLAKIPSDRVLLCMAEFPVLFLPAPSPLDVRRKNR